MSDIEIGTPTHTRLAARSVGPFWKKKTVLVLQIRCYCPERQVFDSHGNGQNAGGYWYWRDATVEDATTSVMVNQGERHD